MGAVPPSRPHTHTHAREGEREVVLGGVRVDGWVGGGGDLDLQAGTRDLSAGTQAWTLLQHARGEQAGFLHTRHDISELIPSSPLLPLPSVFPSTLPPPLPAKPTPPTGCPFASWPRLVGGDGI